MTEKRYNVWDIDGTIFLEDHKEGSYHIGQVGNVDINCLNDIANRLNDLTEENEQLKEALIELKEIGDYQYTRIKELFDENQELEQTNQRLTIALKEIKEKTNIYLEMTKGEDQP